MSREKNKLGKWTTTKPCKRCRELIWQETAHACAINTISAPHATRPAALAPPPWNLREHRSNPLVCCTTKSLPAVGRKKGDPIAFDFHPSTNCHYLQEATSAYSGLNNPELWGVFFHSQKGKTKLNQKITPALRTNHISANGSCTAVLLRLCVYIYINIYIYL